MKESNISSMLLALISRKRFNYSFKTIMKYLFNCICLRNIDKRKHENKYKKHFLYNKGEKKLNNELDVVTLVKSNRNLRLLT